MTVAMLFQRAASTSLHPVLASLLNQIPMIPLGLLGIAVARGRGQRAFGTPNRRAVLAICIASLITYVLNVLLYYRALAISGAVIVSSITASTVIWAGLIAWLIFHKPLTRKTSTGLIVFLIGLIVLAASQSTVIAVSRNWLVGVPLSLFIAVFNGLTTNLIWYSASKKMSHYGAVFLIGIVAVSILSLLALAIRGQFVYDSTSMLYAFVGGSLQAITLFLTTLALAHASVVSVYSILTTNMLWTSLLAWYFLGDPLNGETIAALSIIFVGLLLAQLGQSRKG